MSQMTQSEPVAFDKRMMLSVVAIAMFMTNLDGTVIATVIPVMAREFAINPVNLKLALTSYLLAMAIFIPASGWAADRFGARNVFCMAMVVFTLGSIGCAMSGSLWELVLARTFQGMGGAMLVPVGRIVVLRSLPRKELISALALLAIPQLIAPIFGPPVGGLIATYMSWQWIFWINVPVAMACLGVAYRYLPEVRTQGPTKFDWVGFGLVGPGLAAILAGMSLIGVGLLGNIEIVLLICAGVMLIALFVRHALASDEPLVDLRLLAIPTFAHAVLAAVMFRASIGCANFLVPLVLQVGIGKSAFESGMITFVTGFGAIAMKFIGPPMLKNYGFQRVLLPNAVACGIFAAMPAVFLLDPPTVVIMTILFAVSLSRSLQFVATNAVIYADVPEQKVAAATTLFAMVVEFSGAIGIAIAAAVMHFYQLAKGTSELGADDFVVVFMTVALMSISQLVPLMRLPADVGKSMTRDDETVEKKAGEKQAH